MRILLGKDGSTYLYEVDCVQINNVYEKQQKGLKKVGVATDYYSVEIVVTTPIRPQDKSRIFIAYLTKKDVDELIDDLYTSGKADLRWVKEWRYLI